MLGLIGNLAKGNANCFFAVTHGSNVYKVNLKPWDVVADTAVSPQYPDGKRLIPAASQEDFKRILAHVPDMSKHIQELEPTQEKEVRDSLLRNCSWYKEQAAKEKQSGPKENTSTPIK